MHHRTAGRARPSTSCRQWTTRLAAAATPCLAHLLLWVRLPGRGPSIRPRGPLLLLLLLVLLLLLLLLLCLERAFLAFLQARGRLEDACIVIRAPARAPSTGQGGAEDPPGPDPQKPCCGRTRSQLGKQPLSRQSHLGQPLRSPAGMACAHNTMQQIRLHPAGPRAGRRQAKQAVALGSQAQTAAGPTCSCSTERLRFDLEVPAPDCSAACGHQLKQGRPALP
jgi:hypothetical protein